MIDLTYKETNEPTNGWMDGRKDASLRPSWVMVRIRMLGVMVSVRLMC